MKTCINCADYDPIWKSCYRRKLPGPPEESGCTEHRDASNRERLVKMLGGYEKRIEILKREISVLRRYQRQTIKAIRKLDNGN